MKLSYLRIHTMTYPQKSLPVHLILLAFFIQVSRDLFSQSNPFTMELKKMNFKAGGLWLFLTNIGLICTCVTFAVIVIDDLTTSISRRSPFKLIRIMLLSITLPLESLISLLYWPIRLFATELMFTPDLLKVFPLTLDIAVHAAPTILLWFEYLLYSPKFDHTSRPWISALMLSGPYIYWLETSSAINGFFPYRFLNLMTPFTRAILYIFSIAFIFIVHDLAGYIHSKIITRR